MDRPSNWIEYPNRKEYDRVIRPIHQGVDTDHATFSDENCEWRLMTTESPNGGPHNVFLENSTTGAIVAMGLIRRNLHVINALLDVRYAMAELEGHRGLNLEDMYELHTHLPRYEENEEVLISTWKRRREAASAVMALIAGGLDPKEVKAQAARIVAGLPPELAPTRSLPSASQPIEPFPEPGINLH